MKDKKRINIIFGLVGFLAFIILGFIFQIIYHWNIVEVFMYSIPNGIIFLVIWIAGIKVIGEQDSEKEEK